MKFHLLILTAFLGGLLSCAEGGGSDRVNGGQEAGSSDNEVTISMRAEPVGLNPILSVQNVSRYVYEHIFQTLNERDPETFELVPLLASTPIVTQGADGTITYRYTIDSLAAWPNGTDVTARDVIFSLKALLNPLVEAGPYRPYYDMIQDVLVDSTDERTFWVVTERPYILADQAIADLYIYPEYAYDPGGYLHDIPLSNFADPQLAEQLAEANAGLRTFADAFNSPDLALDPERIVGSGGYALVAWEPGQRLRLRRRDNYWAQDREEDRLAACPEYLNFRIISDYSAEINALRDNSVDVAIDMPVDIFQEMRNDEYLTSLYDFVALPGFKYFSILLNSDDPLLSDSLTRRALAHTVNVDQLIEQLFPGLAQRIVGPVLPAKSYYNNDLPSIPYDLERAARLLREAGWSDSNGNGILDRTIEGERREFQFQLLTYPMPTSEAVTLVIAEGARRVGIDIQVTKMEPRALMARLDAGDFSATFYGQGFEPTPDDFAQVWSSTSVPPSGTNRGNFNNPEADSLIRKIAITMDTSARATLYRRFQEIIYANQPMIFLYSPYDRIVISKRFEYSISSIAPNLKFNALKLKATQ
ncbi:peptide/nickel transport system substrate-binding protein [Lewinella aquimaris]|uniref:Peptide/nickel transport system substrate-binding protein n=1 Tax=Neolewinella aquimaris TaxID=1835722 RepID=A0A840DZ74_9BACT|nr:ABC transporter substrate-binding protein [Neolewinella aquimaris]MBB4078574.1 peptide/nickel transport system substrate-binding protein [Neolewinella aquimaris]